MDEFGMENWLKENIFIIQKRILYISHICRYLNIEREFDGFKAQILIDEDVEHIGNNYVYPTKSDKWSKINDIMIPKLTFLDMNFLKDIFLQTNHQHVLHAIYNKNPSTTNYGYTIPIGVNSYEPTFPIPGQTPTHYIERPNLLGKIQNKIQNEEFAKSRFLIIYGMPGNGKSLLLSKLLESKSILQITNQIKWIYIQTSEKMIQVSKYFSNFKTLDCTFVLDQVRFDFIEYDRQFPVKFPSNRPVIILSNIYPDHINSIEISTMSNKEMKELHKSFDLPSEQNEHADVILPQIGDNLGHHPRSLYEAFTLCTLGRKLEDIVKIILLEPKQIIKRKRNCTIFHSFVEIIDNLQSDITKRILAYIGFLISNDIPYSVLYSILEMINEEQSKEQREKYRNEIIESLKSNCFLEGNPTVNKFRVHSVLRYVLSVKYLKIKREISKEFGDYIELNWTTLDKKVKAEHLVIVDSLLEGKTL